MATTLHIIGYSVRAAAWSAWRAGLRCVAIDAFGDRDLRAIAEAWWPADPRDCQNALSMALRDARAGSARSGRPVLAWGAPFENHPEMLRALQRDWHLVGTGCESLRRVREPDWLAAAAASAGVRFPRTAERPPANDERWLFKLRRSGGGAGVRDAHAAAPPAPEADALQRPRTQEGYYQRFVQGVPGSAVLLADRHQVRLLGWTRQLVGEPLLNAARYAYCGTLATASASHVPDLFDTAQSHWLDGRHAEKTQRYGSSRPGPRWTAFARGVAEIARRARLRGLFGADFVFDGEHLWLIEINPRYTAAVELLELLYHRSLFGDHLRAVGLDTRRLLSARPSNTRHAQAPHRQPGVSHCGFRASATEAAARPEPARFLAKVILFVPARESPGGPRDATPTVSAPRDGLDRTPRPPTAGPPWNDPSLWANPERPFNLPVFADVPPPKALPLPGGPWMTVFASADSLTELRDRIRNRVRSIDAFTPGADDAAAWHPAANEV